MPRNSARDIFQKKFREGFTGKKESSGPKKLHGQDQSRAAKAARRARRNAAKSGGN